MKKSYLVVKGARVNNLKNISVKIPRDKIVVITGLSGSGKSSLAFDTIFAEGHRRYMENLSTYARQFLNVAAKPEVDKIENLSPVIAIDQNSVSRSLRSTVGTMTEIYDYLRTLFALVGQPHCPKCGRLLVRKSSREVADEIISGSKNKSEQIIILASLKDKNLPELIREYEQMGYARVRVGGEVVTIDHAKLDIKENDVVKNAEIVIDRIFLDNDFRDRERLIDSIETAMRIGKGEVVVNFKDRGEDKKYNQYFTCSDCGVVIQEITPRHFSFNSPEGACPACAGLGTKLEVDVDQVIPNKDLSLNEGAIHPGNLLGDRNNNQDCQQRILEMLGKEYGFSLNEPVKKLDQKALDIILYGTGKRFSASRDELGKADGVEASYEGVIPGLHRKYKETSSEYVRREIEKYMTVKTCPACKGRRLRPESLSVLIEGVSIDDLSQMSLTALKDKLSFLSTALKLKEQDKKLIKEILEEVEKTIDSLCDAGLHYLKLSRSAVSLSGGEAQRVRLAVQIGSGLTGILYILDEPSVGLHPRDIQKLIGIFRKLKKEGSSVIVVEHDRQIIEASDWLIDMGPGAGEEGGKIIFEGAPGKILSSSSLTGQYLNGKLKVFRKDSYRRGKKENLVIVGAGENNLKNINVSIPLGKLVVIAGVSGSGKSSLIQDILAKALNKHFYRSKDIPGKHRIIKGLENLSKVISIDQSPIGRTPRSNVVTYTGIFSLIREIFAQTEEAKKRGYTPSRFSFNMKGGRCEICQGEGRKKIEMQLLPGVYIECDACRGTRYNQKTLEVEYQGVNIAEVLDMSVSYALKFFRNFPLVVEKLQTLNDVGLGYLKLGQSAVDLSGGEAQRIKLAAELARRSNGRALYILDEPTVGLHFEDTARLLEILDGLVEKGNTVLVVEHNQSVIKAADWVIELGPEGGEEGGRIVFEGTPEKLAKAKTWTGKYLR